MKNTNKGFTFIELIVVIAIASIMFAIATVSYVNISKNSRDARRKSDMESIRQALELCRSFTGSYSATVYPSIVCGTQTYMTKTPVDPKKDALGNDVQYVYAPGGAGPIYTTYTLTGNLEIGGSYSVTNP